MADTVPIVRGRFCLGAKPSPRLALMMAAPHRVLRTPPPQFAVVPKQLDLWGNGDYGDCVTAEEMFAKAVWSLMSGLPELFITAAAAVAWAKENGYLDGAMLTEVMTTMAKKGIVVGGTTYKDGGYTSVDYTDETNLRSSLANGPVKIGIDHAALPDDAGNANGWVGLGGKHNYNNTDHCVGLSGYGPAGWLFQQLGVPLPSTLASDTQGYLLFTWATIGFVDHKWILSRLPSLGSERQQRPVRRQSRFPIRRPDHRQRRSRCRGVACSVSRSMARTRS